MPRRAQNEKIADNSTARKTKTVISGRAAVSKKMQTIAADLECPADLDGIAAKKWAEIVALCNQSEYKFLNNLDSDLLKVYCDSYERYEIARRTWRKTCKKEIASADTATQKMIDKCILEMSRAGDELNKYARALNLTSAERERLAVANGKFAQSQKSAIMDFING